MSSRKCVVTVFCISSNSLWRCAIFIRGYIDLCYIFSALCYILSCIIKNDRFCVKVLPINAIIAENLKDFYKASFVNWLFRIV